MIMTLKERYFDWLYDMMCAEKFSNSISYRQLFERMHHTPFTWSIQNDSNRAKDGIDLRYRFSMLNFDDNEVQHAVRVLQGPCSVLEMLCGLAIRCEENLMDDTRYGDRTSQWFWTMISSMGLQSQWNDNFDPNVVDSALDKMISRRYKPNGDGGLFKIPGCKEDLTKVEIWVQMNWYMDRIS